MNFSFELEKKWSRRWGVKCHDNRQALSNNVGDFIGPDPDPYFFGGSGSGSAIYADPNPDPNLEKTDGSGRIRIWKGLILGIL